MRPPVNETIFKELKVSLQTYKQHTGVRQNCISCKYILNFKRPIWQV